MKIKNLLIISLLLSMGLYMSAATLSPMKQYKSRVFFGSAQMRSIIDFCSIHKKYTFMSFGGNGEIKFWYCKSGKQKTSIEIEVFNCDTVGIGKEIELKVPVSAFAGCPGNYNPDNSLKCLRDIGRFINIEPLAIDRLSIVFNKYIIRNNKYKNHNIKIMGEALRRGGLLGKYKKRNTKYEIGEFGFYFQLTKKWRLRVFIKKWKKDINNIYYRLTDYTGEEKFIIDLTKK